MSIFDIICDYANKNLPEVPENVLNMSNLKMLYLEDNLIVRLPNDFFEKLTKLSWLDLRKNKLTTVPVGIAHHAFLETLLLQDNNIEELPNEIGVVPNLKVLQVSGNPLKYPVQKVINEGVDSVCRFLKLEYYKNSKTSISEEEEKREISVVERKSSSGLTKSSEKASVTELLRRSVSAQRLKSLTQVLPVIDVKSLSKTNSEEDEIRQGNITVHVVRPNSAKNIHKITRGCSKISLRSHSQWNSKRKPTETERVQQDELKEIWLKKLREVLADQEKILQQEKNLKALSKWRLDKKIEAPRSVETLAEAPFAIDPECNRMLSRKDLTDQIDKMISKSKKSNKKNQASNNKVDVQQLINEVVEQMKNMESRLSKPSSPRAEQNKAAKQIESIVELHKKILALQVANNDL